MAERRMFAKSIIDSDLFLDMPASTQNLYFHLGMRADDDGFVNSPQKIMRMVSCSKNDMDMLVFKQFIIPFDTGICVIKHWRIHNYIRNDRYSPTLYNEEMSRLSLDESKMYTFCIPSVIPELQNGIPDDIPVGDAGKVRLGKDSLGKVSEDEVDGRKRPTRVNFTPPTIDEVINYCNERNNSVDPEKWYDYYTSNGWKVGKNKMSDWKAAVRTWERTNTSSSTGGLPKGPKQAASRYNQMDVLNDLYQKALAKEEEERERTAGY